MRMHGGCDALPSVSRLSSPHSHQTFAFPLSQNQHHMSSPKYLYHYTTEESFEKILESGHLLPSRGPGDTALGVGVYFTTKPPQSSNSTLLDNNYSKQGARDNAKVECYIRINADEVEYVDGRDRLGRDVFVVPGDEGVYLSDAGATFGPRLRAAAEKKAEADEKADLHELDEVLENLSQVLHHLGLGQRVGGSYSRSSGGAGGGGSSPWYSGGGGGSSPWYSGDGGGGWSRDGSSPWSSGGRGGGSSFSGEYSSGGGSGGGGQNWNAFRTAHAGEGLTRDGTGPGSMSWAYRNQ